MANSVTVTGVKASIKWVYQEAATLGAWTVTRAENIWTLSASIEKSDAHRVAQRPLRFVAPHAEGAWVWPILELHVSGASLHAVLGPPEK